MFLKTNVLFIIFMLIDTVYVKKCTKSVLPVIITTWAFENATSRAWLILKDNGTALDAVELGATVCEQQQCDGTVGFGGSPDELGETTLDAMIMDGSTMNVGAVGNLRRIKNAAAVARHVLDYTKHSILTGDQATEFAKHMGFTEESLTTPESKQLWKRWHNEDHCQPNFWMHVVPNPEKQCGPYRPNNFFGDELRPKRHHKPAVLVSTTYNHDTIGIVAIDHKGNIAASTSTNGAKYKIPGRIGDSPIPGAGAYAENNVGGAAATGDGDIMLRFLPSFLAVDLMRRGLSPTEAALTAIRRISKYYPDFMGAVVALNKDGEYGAACHGMVTFPFVVQNVIGQTHKLDHVVC